VSTTSLAALPCGTGLPGSLQASASPPSCRPALLVKVYLKTEPCGPPLNLTATASGPPPNADAPLPTSLQGRRAHRVQPPAGPTFVHTPRRRRASACDPWGGRRARHSRAAAPPPPVNQQPGKNCAGAAHSRRLAGDLLGRALQQQAAPRTHERGCGRPRPPRLCAHRQQGATTRRGTKTPGERVSGKGQAWPHAPTSSPGRKSTRTPGTTKRGWRQTNNALHCGANPTAGAARCGGRSSRQRQQNSRLAAARASAHSSQHRQNAPEGRRQVQHKHNEMGDAVWYAQRRACRQRAAACMLPCACAACRAELAHSLSSGPSTRRISAVPSAARGCESTVKGFFAIKPKMQTSCTLTVLAASTQRGPSTKYPTSYPKHTRRPWFGPHSWPCSPFPTA